MPIATINPATGQLLKSFDALSDAQIEAKVKLAAETFPKFRKLTFAERAVMMNKAADILETDKEALGRLMTRKWARHFVPRLTKP